MWELDCLGSGHRGGEPEGQSRAALNTLENFFRHTVIWREPLLRSLERGGV